MTRTRTRQALLAPWRGLALLAETLLQLSVWTLAALTIPAALMGVGVRLLPFVLRLVSGLALLARLKALR